MIWDYTTVVIQVLHIDTVEHGLVLQELFCMHGTEQTYGVTQSFPQRSFRQVSHPEDVTVTIHLSEHRGAITQFLYVIAT